MSNSLPSVCPEAYKDPVRYPVLEPDELIASMQLIEDHYRDVSNDDKASLALTPVELRVAEGLLRFVDYCLPQDHQGLPVNKRIYFARGVAERLLSVVPVSELDLDDLRQIQRLNMMRALRSYDSRRGAQVFGILALEFASGARGAGVRAQKGGFNYEGITRNLTNRSRRPLFNILDNILTNDIEDGYSDEIEMWKQHHAYTIKEPLDDSSSSEIDLGIEDGESKQWLDLVELPRTGNLDRVFESVATRLDLSEKDKKFLWLYYGERLTQAEIGDLPEFNCTPQALSMRLAKLLKQLRSVSRSTGLKDLYR